MNPQSLQKDLINRDAALYSAFEYISAYLELTEEQLDAQRKVVQEARDNYIRAVLSIGDRLINQEMPEEQSEPWYKEVDDALDKYLKAVLSIETILKT